MIEDEIIREVRKNREELLKLFDYDLDKMVAWMRAHPLAPNGRLEFPLPVYPEPPHYAEPPATGANSLASPAEPA